MYYFLTEVANLSKCKSKNFLTYGFNQNADYQIINIRRKINHSIFDLKVKFSGEKIYKIKNIKVNIIGDHNISNVTAAVAVAINLGIKINKIKIALRKFLGIQRRFTKVFCIDKKEFYDDYAHHPTEIKEVLDGVKNVYKDYEKICVFQPHRISRLKDLKKEFSFAFKKADMVVLCPIYTAGERIKLGFNYLNFAKTIAKNSKVNVFMINNETDLMKYIKQNIYGEKIVIGMGAGSISNWIRRLPKLI